jgi:small subunit ribosomal protein S20
MAYHKSAKTRIRRNARRAEINRSRRTHMRGALRRVDEAIASGDKTAAQEALRAAQPEVARGAGQKLLHRNTASRKISRLAISIKAMAG